MASMVRRLQIRQMKKQDVSKIPVLCEDTGKTLAVRWPRRKGQLAYTPTGQLLMAPSDHSRLKPLLQIYAEAQRGAN